MVVDQRSLRWHILVYYSTGTCTSINPLWDISITWQRDTAPASAFQVESLILQEYL